MATGGLPQTAGDIKKVQEDVLKLWNIVKLQPEISQEQKNHIKALYNGVIHSLCKGLTTETHCVTPHTCHSSSQFLQLQIVIPITLPDGKIPFISNTSLLVPGSIPVTLPVFILMSSARSQHLEQPSKTRMPFSPVLEKAQLALKSSKVSFLVVPMLLSPHHVTVIQWLNITKVSSRHMAAKVLHSLSSLSTKD